MGKVRTLKQFKETEGIVPAFVGPERGRNIMVRFHERGVYVKAKGKHNVLFISWDEVYGLAIRTDAHEKLKEKKRSAK